MFRDRDDAGARLAEAVAALGLEAPVVLALPRGGVPVALPVARRLGAPLDLLMVRKLGAPGHEELAAGAVVEGDGPITVFNPDILHALGMTEADFAGAIRDRLAEIASRRARYLGGRPPVPLAGRTAVVVDDGVATGATVRAALAALRLRAPRGIVLAVPVGAPEALDALAPEVDVLVALERPHPFLAVGAHYQFFDQLDDETVRGLLSGLDPARDGGG
jgi:putative phosphoribosyl transferase